MHTQCFYAVLDLEVGDKAQATREAAATLRDVAAIPQATASKEMCWVETATVFDDLPDLQTAVKKDLL